MNIGSPAHGQLIDSQLTEDGYPVYWNAEIISEASYFIARSYCPKYKHTLCIYICKKKITLI